MRNGRWTKDRNFGEGSTASPGFPAMPNWFKDSRDFRKIAVGLGDVGFNDDEVGLICGGNWLQFFERSFTAQTATGSDRDRPQEETSRRVG